MTRDNMKKRMTRTQEHELALWCEEQKRLYKEGKLEEYKIKKLEALSFWKWE